MSSFDYILIPRMQVQQLMKKGSGLGKKSKQTFAGLSHCRFFDKLLFKCSKKGRSLIKVSEAHSSRRCHCCGSNSPPGFSRMFKCTNHRCGLKMRRDENAARGILQQTPAKIVAFLKAANNNNGYFDVDSEDELGSEDDDREQTESQPIFSVS